MRHKSMYSFVVLTLDLDALSLSYLGYIRHENNLRVISSTLAVDDYTSPEFVDCLRPAYSIPGLIAYLANTFDLGDSAARPSYALPSTIGRK